jgi:hypothetical protein
MTGSIRNIHSGTLDWIPRNPMVYACLYAEFRFIRLFRDIAAVRKEIIIMWGGG